MVSWNLEIFHYKTVIWYLKAKKIYIPVYISNFKDIGKDIQLIHVYVLCKLKYFKISSQYGICSQIWKFFFRERQERQQGRQITQEQARTTQGGLVSIPCILWSLLGFYMLHFLFVFFCSYTVSTGVGGGQGVYFLCQKWQILNSTQ